MGTGNKGRFWLAAAVIVGLSASMGSMAMAERIEEPRYERLLDEGDFEVRRYAPSLVAQTEVRMGFRESLYTGFRRLANFIFGANTAATEIAMTAPVGQVRTPTGYAVTFTMPSQFDRSSLPKPRDRRVEIAERPERTVAVLEFGGWARESRTRKKTQELLDMLKRRGLAPAGQAELAQYDPPWRPIGRRNEIQVPLAAYPGQ